MCLFMDLSLLVLFETLYFLDLDIYSFPSLGDFSSIITSNNLSAILSLFSFLDLCMKMLVCWMLSERSHILKCLFLCLFSSCDFHHSVF